MACRNNYLVSVLILVLMYFLFFKPINIKETSCMDNRADENPGETPGEIIPDSDYTYGGINMVYNSDPSDIKYYRINVSNDQLNVPNSQILTNKNLYEYSTTTVPKEKNLTNFIHKDNLYSDLVDDTYCCDDIMNRELVQSYLYDNAKNRYSSIRESYFD